MNFEHGIRAENGANDMINNLSIPDDISSLLTHIIGNPAHSVQLSLTAFEKIWHELLPVLDAYQREHGDFEIGGYLYSELKRSMLQSIKTAQDNIGRIKRIVHYL